MKTLNACLFFFFTLAIVGCKEEVDDQTIVQGEAWRLVNPAPSKRNFVQNNQNHQVIVAVIDSGTDYNHPQLINNIHFTLDKNGQPVGLGYDFIGKDHWPSPYVARTLDLNPEADSRAATKTRVAREQATLLVKAHPQLQPFLNPLRNFEQEAESGAFHGTHVSGLLVYDDPRIGLVSYRVLPLNIKYKNGREDLSEDKTATAFSNIMQAMSMAVKAGARVINMSLALKAASADSLFGSNKTRDQIKKWMTQVQSFMNSQPDVIFVAAAGNDGQWVDDKTNLQLPCGISAQNLVCVGALDETGNLAYFSNIVLSQSTFVATTGVDIISTRPTDMCDSKSLHYLENQNASSLNYLVNQYTSDCLGKKPIVKSSGTSMASPIVARTVAQLMIADPKASAREIIKDLVDIAKKDQLGPLLLNKLPFETPKWANSKLIFVNP